MERGWSAADDAAPVRVLRDVLRLWRRVIDGEASSSRSPVVAARARDVAAEAEAEAEEAPARGRARRSQDPDPFAYVRVGIDPLEIHLD